jgi:hypothetical protein
MIEKGPTRGQARGTFLRGSPSQACGASCTFIYYYYFELHF